jgi:hypothetical protein
MPSPTRRTSSVFLAVLLATTAIAANPSPTLAGPESDIPGVPLPGPVATGRLGGPIYDVVYRLVVPAGYVIVAGLTGTPGSDFDIYLFDATATRVVSTQGLLAKSTGPTSSENLSYPSFAGGTYYIDLNGATDVEGTYTLTVQLIADQTEPIASLLLADGKASVNTTTVTVRLTAYSPLSGVSQMSFSADGVTFGAWQTYTVQSTWTFPPGDGPKRLWAKVRSGVGVESPAAQDVVLLDTVPPTPASITPVPGQTVANLRPSFMIRFDEPVEPASWNQLGLVVQAANGQRVDGAYTFDAASNTGTFLPGFDLSAGMPYVVTIGQVRDLAGNAAQPLSSWTVTPLRPSSLSISASQSLVQAGSNVVITGASTGLDGEGVLFSVRQGGSTTSTEIGPLAPSTGRLSVLQTPTMTTWYRWRYPGSTTTAPAESPEFRVLVRRQVELVGVSPDVTRTGLAGSVIRLVAQVLPAGGGARLSFRRYRYDAIRRAYVYSGSFGRTTDAQGRASLTWTAPSGRWYWRVAVLSSPEFANNISGVYRWSIAQR